jgi:hypothetical protein
MTPNKQAAAAQAANTLITLAQQFLTLRSQAADFIKQYNSELYSVTWANFQTAVQNLDGSLGAADGSPNTAHPIDNRVITTLTRAVTQAQLVAMENFLNDYINFLTNVNPGAAQRSQTIDDLAS